MREPVLVQDFVVNAAMRFPHKTAVWCGERRLTYAELHLSSNAMAHSLVSLGVERGDRVQIFSENALEVVIAWWAVLKANAVPTVLSPLTRTEKLTYYLNDSRAKVLIAQQQLSERWVQAVQRSAHLQHVVVIGCTETEPGLLRVGFNALLASGNPDFAPKRHTIDADLAAIIYTSGSTGAPKGVMLTHRNISTASHSLVSLLELSERDVIFSALPLAFNYGLYQAILAARCAGTLVLERDFAFPVRALERIEQTQATGFAGVPTQFSLLAGLRNVKAELSGLRFITNTAAALTDKHVDALERLFPKAQIFSMYGLTECKRCSYLPPGDLHRKPGSVGIAFPNSEFWLVDENDQSLPPGQVGELVVRGSNVMRGYWNQPEATAERLRPGPLPGEVVLYTGDLCRTDDDGYLYFVSRADDVIKSRGEKVAPHEVEAALARLPGVKEAAVIGVPDDLLGQAVKAFVVSESEAQLDAKTLIRDLQRILEPFMVPRWVVVVDALPKTETGKIKKSALQ